MAKVLLIYGPTAAGKSALARDAARRLGGEIINADALQVYRELQLLSARPSRGDMGDIPHHLYGHISARASYSVGAWREAAGAAIKAVIGRGGLPILVGGSGLYLRSLTDGLSAIPAIDPAIRAGLRQRLSAEGAPALHQELRAVDAALAEKIAPTDSQRIMRGLEIFEGTGLPLSQWQTGAAQSMLGGIDFIKTLLAPPRARLIEAAEARLDDIVKLGVLAEVKALKALDLPPHQPALKALGFAALSDHLDGRLSLADALSLAKRATRHYIRRQLTWARNQMTDYVSAPSAAALGEKIGKIIK